MNVVVVSANVPGFSKFGLPVWAKIFTSARKCLERALDCIDDGLHAGIVRVSNHNLDAVYAAKCPPPSSVRVDLEMNVDRMPMTHRSCRACAVALCPFLCNGTAHRSAFDRRPGTPARKLHHDTVDERRNSCHGPPLIHSIHHNRR